MRGSGGARCDWQERVTIEVVEGQGSSRPECRNLCLRQPVRPKPRKTRRVQQRMLPHILWHPKRHSLQKCRTADWNPLLGQERPHGVTIERVRTAPDDDVIYIFQALHRLVRRLHLDVHLRCSTWNFASLGTSQCNVNVAGALTDSVRETVPVSHISRLPAKAAQKGGRFPLSKPLPPA